jgi:hypothetical protein
MIKERIDKAIVITTINSPSKAIHLFSKLPGYRLIVIGDQKTPADWSYSNTVFISALKQEKSGLPLVNNLPWNHYSRKMIGYLYAINAGANIIVDTDDDNLPLSTWWIPDFYSNYLLLPENLGFVNVYSYFTEQDIWPRGFPLNHIRIQQREVFNHLKPKLVSVGIWQGLADQEPDVDAIYRLIKKENCIFEQKAPLVFSKNSLCPFNSQNTVFHKKCFPLLYLPVTVTFRFTDILRGLIAQPIMWDKNMYLGFLAPTVLQERNSHDYMEDFIQEISCYLYGEKIVDWVISTIRAGHSTVDNLYNTYHMLVNKGIVLMEEMKALETWLLSF